MVLRPAVGVVLAAGRGERFAAADPASPPKALVPIGGVPMVRRTVKALLDGGVDRCVVVVASIGAAAVGEALAGLAVHLVINPDPSRGMFSSVQCGVAAVEASVPTCLLTPADLPFVRPATVAAILQAAAGGDTVSPRHAGRGGHPVALSARLRTAIAAAPPTATLQGLLKTDHAVPCQVADAGIVRDVDRPSDLI